MRLHHPVQDQVLPHLRHKKAKKRHLIKFNSSITIILKYSSSLHNHLRKSDFVLKKKEEKCIQIVL